MEYEEDLLDEIAQEELTSRDKRQHVVIQLEEIINSNHNLKEQLPASAMR